MWIVVLKQEQAVKDSAVPTEDSTQDPGKVT